MPQRPDPERVPPSGPSLRRAAPLIVLALVAAAGFWLSRDLATLETLGNNRETLIDWRDRNYALVALGYVAVFVAIVALSLPGALVMTVTGGFLFGLGLGSALAVLSGSTGALLIFLAARAGLGEGLRVRLLAHGAQGFFARIERGLKANEVSYLLLMRLVPAVPFVVANVAPAFLGVRPWTFYLTTLFGILPGTFITAWIGVGIGEVFDAGGTPDLSLVTQPHILGPIAGLVALAALPIALRALRRGGGGRRARRL